MRILRAIGNTYTSLAADRIEALEGQAAELRYEAGMYQSLYENAKARIEALEAALREIADDVRNDGLPSWTAKIARAALAPEQDK